MQNLESKLNELLVTKAPFQIPKEGREGIVRIMPWVTLLGGVLMLGVAWTLWNLVSMATAGLNLANSVYGVYNMSYVAPAAAWSPLVWLSIILLAVEAVMFFMAYKGLVAHKKSAWNLLFYVSLLSAAEAILQFIGYTNFGTLLGAVIGAVVGLYVLFQIRGYYTGAAAPVSGGNAPTPTK